MRDPYRIDSLLEPAPEGTIYVCAACGKTSNTRSGWYSDNTRSSDGRWDESCMLHAVLCYKDKNPGGIWVAYNGGKP